MSLEDPGVIGEYSDMFPFGVGVPRSGMNAANDPRIGDAAASCRATCDAFDISAVDGPNIVEVVDVVAEVASAACLVACRM